MPAPGEPSSLMADPLELITGYLDFFEDVTLRKISGLGDDQLRISTVPAGWTPHHPLLPRRARTRAADAELADGSVGSD
jgi:hypothetical protein